MDLISVKHQLNAWGLKSTVIMMKNVAAIITAMDLISVKLQLNAWGLESTVILMKNVAVIITATLCMHVKLPQTKVTAWLQVAMTAVDGSQLRRSAKKQPLKHITFI